MTVILDIFSQHEEEMAFLWLLRSNAIRQPHYALKDLAKLDERVERIAKGAGSHSCEPGTYRSRVRR